jgi:hypothetical protein
MFNIIKLYRGHRWRNGNATSNLLMTDKQKAINFFIKHTSYTARDIQDISQLHNGFTNISFKFKTRERKIYQVRLSKQPDVVDRTNEFKAIKAANFDYFVYYEPKSGNAIKN